MENNERKALCYTCKYCRRGFNDMPSLNSHKRDFHLDEILRRKQFQKHIPVQDVETSKSLEESAELQKLPERQLTAPELKRSLTANHEISDVKEPPIDTTAISTEGPPSLKLANISLKSISHSVSPENKLESAASKPTITSNQLLQCKYCPVQLSQSELLSHHATHERAFRCQKCLTSYGTFPLLNAHIKAGCSERVPDPVPLLTPSPLETSISLSPPTKETDDFYIPPISRSIYDEFYVPTDESSISSDPSEDEEIPQKPESSGVKIQKKTFKYHCRFCGKGQNFLSQNLQHERIHIKSHHCSQCPAKFAEFYLLRNHIVKRHGPDNRAPKTKSKMGKLNHAKLNKTNGLKPVPVPPSEKSTKLSQKGIKCSICSKHLKNNENLKIHMRIHSGVKPFACQHCPYRATQWGQLNSHLKCHIESNEFQCHLCNASYKNEPFLSRHIKHVHNLARPETELENCSSRNSAAEDVELEDMAFPLIDIKQPSNSKTVGVEYDCPNCSKKCATLSQFASHEAFHLGQRDFVCNFCEFGFTRKRDLARHNKSKNHLALAQSSQFKSLPRPPTKIRIAPSMLISKQTPNKASSVVVQQNQSRDKPACKTFPCLLCEKSFTSQGSLGNHIKVHRDGEGKIQCTVCRKSLTTFASLRTHLRKHSGEKPYSCEHCGKQFMYQTSFKRHVASHSGRRQFVCTECPANFVLKTDLTRHFYRIHALEGKDNKNKNEHKSLSMDLSTAAGEEYEEEELSEDGATKETAEEDQDVFEFQDL